MNTDFFEKLQDKYLQTDFGRGVFLAGVALGTLANAQLEYSNGKKVEDTPLFKQINFGKMSLRELKKHMSRIPELTKAYRIDYSSMISALASKAGELMLNGGSKDLGVDGNFAFTVAFMNSKEYFWGKIFKKKEEE
ncbi:TM1802 family CRISPR-associated protein [Mesoaciditoga lauensis]|uniref:TM1802 family CRISPR-associated protein n=1 Tax=Mesoaciditoga lauensis TaxID=1495039 RepID=UPI00056A7047|nr:TM1802 family CRISPR-associated protein [Mesoaciditoga lauensis]